MYYIYWKLSSSRPFSEEARLDNDDLFMRDANGTVLLDSHGYPVLKDDVDEEGDEPGAFPSLRDEVIVCIEQSEQRISFDQLVIASFEDTDEEDTLPPYRRGYRIHGVPLTMR